MAAEDQGTARRPCTTLRLPDPGPRFSRSPCCRRKRDGTGSNAATFARTAAADPTAPTGATNPHNQILATAIPLGLAGTVLLLAIWAAHLRMFLRPEPMAWIGLSVVAQNIVGSLFNSHLFDFSQGWLYVFGVGIAGGILLRKPVSRRQVSRWP